MGSAELPQGAVAGLAEILGALGDELRVANRKIGERRYGDEAVEPILLFDHATVEFETVVTTSGQGGVRFWVLSGNVQHAQERTVKITVDLNGPQGGLEAGA